MNDNQAGEFQMQTVAIAIHSALVARDNCEKNGNCAWHQRWTRRLRALGRERLPSGSGIDNGTRVKGLTKDGRGIELLLEFHHHGEHGYDGWTYHTARVRPSFLGLDISISGPNRNDIKDYLADVLREALNAECLPVSE